MRSLTNENGTILSMLDYDSYGTISRAPVPANTTSGGPVLTAAESELTHGSAGMFPIPLPLSGAPGIEMRTHGGTYTVMLTFDRPVLTGTATIASGVGTVSGLPSFSGNTATVQLSGVADRQTITVELDNVVGVPGLTNKVLVAMSVLIGDVNQDGAVTVVDYNLVRSSSGSMATTDTFKKDINADGWILSGDYTSTSNSVSQGAELFPDFAFTGHYYHARSGLYFSLYRPYIPSLGRWMSRDPIGEAGGINLYGYVENNPATLTDVYGLIPLPPGPLGGNAIVKDVQQGIKKETGTDISKDAAKCLIEHTSIPDLKKIESDDRAKQKEAATDILNKLLSDKSVPDSIKNELRKLLK